jgi:ketosteroid isomerase-like protein
MSEENLETVREVYQAWNRGDLEWVLNRIAPDSEFHTVPLFPDLEHVYRGREGFTRFWKTFRESWESVLTEVERIEPIGDDQVLVLFRFHGRGRNGVDVRRPYAQLFTIESRLIRRVVGFADWQQALEAAGLAER